MGERPDDPESGAGEPKPPKIKAEDNPWYLLATLYGVQDDLLELDLGLRDKNRIAWNRYFAANLDEETRALLIYKLWRPAEELTSFSSDELQEVEVAFAKRKGSAREMSLPASGSEIDFSNVQFDKCITFDRYLFTKSFFQGATFSGKASFFYATFSGSANFDVATFSANADFGGATFLNSGYFGAGFNGATFSGVADFSGATFSGKASFFGATFSGSANFDVATFSGEASFFGASFSGTPSFYRATFSRATFDGATFSSGAGFGGAIFSSGAGFDGATFSGLAGFNDATFSGGAFFDVATFSGEADFRGATISGVAHFDGAIFSGVARFSKATFGRTTSFVNAELKGRTSFEKATFKTEPPEFFDAKLHEGTVWRSITWPKPKDKVKAGSFLDAYERLKLEMHRLEKHEDELNFFAREMQSRRILQGPVRGLPIALYGLLSGYGRSYVRPLVALFVVAAIGAGAFWYIDARAYGEALGLSAANTLNVFGFRRDFGLAIDTPFTWLLVLSAVQTMLGTILLFLFGLGIRNKFRMK